ncbi:hypothetical protein Bbelb_141050 [Branchiostoma belcheri]|nr:hypothetical protein Bbelb_141050 [Branchiostoma belcheri]
MTHDCVKLIWERLVPPGRAFSFPGEASAPARAPPVFDLMVPYDACRDRDQLSAGRVPEYHDGQIWAQKSHSATMEIESPEPANLVRYDVIRIERAFDLGLPANLPPNTSRPRLAEAPVTHSEPSPEHQPTKNLPPNTSRPRLAEAPVTHSEPSPEHQPTKNLPTNTSRPRLAEAPVTHSEPSPEHQPTKPTMAEPLFHIQVWRSRTAADLAEQQPTLPPTYSQPWL